MTRPPKSERLADHVRPRLPESRIERQWAAIEAAGLPGPARARKPWGVIAGFAVAAALASYVVVVFVRAPQALPAGALLESPAEVAVKLEDGSRVQLSPKAQLRLLENHRERVELELRSGTARFQVTHDRARRFAIMAGPAEVRVIGTRFALTRKPQAGNTLVRIDVSEGVVEVRRRDLAGAEPQRISAGESWSVLIRDRAEPAPPKPSTPPPSTVLEPEPESEPESAREKPAPAPSKAGRPDADAADARAPDDPASELFRRASLARRAGQMKEAAQGYAELLARHPDDARAGLSAFELGRIRMDALGDPDGAIGALEQALRSSANASFHEDALARIVVASDVLGRTEACRRARERYLERYPDGVHRHALAARCK